MPVLDADQRPRGGRLLPQQRVRITLRERGQEDVEPDGRRHERRRERDEDHQQQPRANATGQQRRHSIA
jgi:hypothetical protein